MVDEYLNDNEWAAGFLGMSKIPFARHSRLEHWEKDGHATWSVIGWKPNSDLNQLVLVLRATSHEIREEVRSSLGSESIYANAMLEPAIALKAIRKAVKTA